jgi:hypothetical protein
MKGSLDQPELFEAPLPDTEAPKETHVRFLERGREAGTWEQTGLAIQDVQNARHFESEKPFEKNDPPNDARKPLNNQPEQQRCVH